MAIRSSRSTKLPKIQARPKRHYSARVTRARLAGRSFRLHRMAGVLLIVLAAAVAVTHLAEHAHVIDPLPGNLEDLLIGFPTASLLLLAGFVALIWR